MRRLNSTPPVGLL